MSNFIIYDKNTGDILRTGSCPESMMNIQVDKEIESIMEGAADDACDKVNLETKKVMKEYKTTRKKIQEEEERIWEEEAPQRERERIIKERVDQNNRNKAIQELIDEGIIE